MFWVNCEVRAFGGGGAEGVCPVQIRGHRMGGVSELSVAKVVLGGLVVLAYVGYCGYLVKVVGVFSKRKSSLGCVSNGAGGRMASFGRRARFARGRGGRAEMVEGGDVESVVVVIEGKKETR